MLPTLAQQIRQLPAWAKITISIAFSGSAFVSGTVTAVGFEFLPLIDKGQLLFSIAFYGSILVLLLNFLRGLTILIYRAWSNIFGWLASFISKRVRSIVAGFLAILALSLLIFSTAATLKVKVVGAHSSLLLLFAVSLFVTAFGSAEPFWRPSGATSSSDGPLQKLLEHLATLAPALVAFSAFAFGYAMVDFLRISAKPVQVETTDGRVSDMRIAMTGENGMLLFRTTFVDECSVAVSTAVYLPRDEIKAIYGRPQASLLFPAYLPGGRSFSLTNSANDRTQSETAVETTCE